MYYINKLPYYCESSHCHKLNTIVNYHLEYCLICIVCLLKQMLHTHCHKTHQDHQTEVRVIFDIRYSILNIEYPPDGYWIFKISLKK